MRITRRELDALARSYARGKFYTDSQLHDTTIKNAAERILAMVELNPAAEYVLVAHVESNVR